MTRRSLRRFHPMIALWTGLLATVLVSLAGAATGLRVDGIAAVVGEDIILLSEVFVHARPMLTEAGRQGESITPAQKKEIIRGALDEMIDDKLVALQAAEMKIEVTTEEVDATVANMARENGLDPVTFEKALEAQGTTMPEYRATMRRELLKYKVINLRVRGRVKIGEAEARDYYNNQVRDVRAGGRFTGAHILIRVPGEARAIEVAKLRNDALAIREQLQAGADFATLARKVSQDTVTAPHGGSLGSRMPGEIPRTLDLAFADLEAGEIAGPIRTSAGFHIIKVLEREDLGVQPFAEVKDRIVNQLIQDEMLRQQKIWLSELRKKTFIDIRL